MTSSQSARVCPDNLTTHPSERQIVGFVEGSIRYPQNYLIEKHLQVCLSCRKIAKEWGEILHSIPFEIMVDRGNLCIPSGEDTEEDFAVTPNGGCYLFEFQHPDNTHVCLGRCNICSPQDKVLLEREKEDGILRIQFSANMRWVWRSNRLTHIFVDGVGYVWVKGITRPSEIENQYNEEDTHWVLRENLVSPLCWE